MKDQLPMEHDNPNGLYQRYLIEKIKGWESHNDILGDPYYGPITEPVDKDAEYFVMRLDEGGSDIEHIKACRIGIHAYADAIEIHLPKLAKDLKERYPLIDQPKRILPIIPASDREKLNEGVDKPNKCKTHKKDKCPDCGRKIKANPCDEKRNIKDTCKGNCLTNMPADPPALNVAFNSAGRSSTDDYCKDCNTVLNDCRDCLYIKYGIKYGKRVD